MTSDPADPHAHEAATRSRVAVSVLFALAGTVMGAWSGRIPSVREQLGVGDGLWGVLILAAPIGSLLSLLVATRVIAGTGARALALPGAVGLLLVAPVTASSTHPWALVTCLFVQGLAQGLLFSPMNVLAVRVERSYHRSILSSFHAWFSLGQLTGGLLGVLAGALLVSPGVQLAVTDLALAGLLLASARWLPDDRPRSEPTTRVPIAAPSAARRGGWTAQVAVLAAIGFLTGVNEGAATQWSAWYAVSLGASVSVGALTLVCFSTAIALVRLRGDRLITRWGRVRFLQVSASVAAAGMGLALLVGTVPAALLGFAALGLGSGCIVPVVTSLAGLQPDVPAARAVSLVNLGSWPAFLLGPPAVGLVAEVVGLRAALGLVVLSASFICLVAGSLHDRSRPGRS